MALSRLQIETQSSQPHVHITEHEDVRTREATFRDWSGQVPADRMYRIGLYYTGEGDCVRCFKCQVLLQGWRTGDDPYRVHARRSPNCPLVQHNLARSYARGNPQEVTHQVHLEQETHSLEPAEITGSAAEGENETDEHHNRIAAVQSCRDMGYSEEQISDAKMIYRRQNSNREDYHGCDLARIMEDMEQSTVAGGSLPEDGGYWCIGPGELSWDQKHLNQYPNW